MSSVSQNASFDWSVAFICMLLQKHKMDACSRSDPLGVSTVVDNVGIVCANVSKESASAPCHVTTVPINSKNNTRCNLHCRRGFFLPSVEFCVVARNCRVATRQKGKLVARQGFGCWVVYWPPERLPNFNSRVLPTRELKNRANAPFWNKTAGYLKTDMFLIASCVFFIIYLRITLNQTPRYSCTYWERHRLRYETKCCGLIQNRLLNPWGLELRWYFRRGGKSRWQECCLESEQCFWSCRTCWNINEMSYFAYAWLWIDLAQAGPTTALCFCSLEIIMAARSLRVYFY